MGKHGPWFFLAWPTPASCKILGGRDPEELGQWYDHFTILSLKSAIRRPRSTALENDFNLLAGAELQFVFLFILFLPKHMKRMFQLDMMTHLLRNRMFEIGSITLLVLVPYIKVNFTI